MISKARTRGAIVGSLVGGTLGLILSFVAPGFALMILPCPCQTRFSTQYIFPLTPSTAMPPGWLSESKTVSKSEPSRLTRRIL